MKVNRLYCIVFLFSAALFSAPFSAVAVGSSLKDGPSSATEVGTPGTVTGNPAPGQDDKQVKKKKPDQKPDVKEVPKSRRQPKPAAVKPKVKMKTPVKKVKPVIKKPLRLVRMNLGR